MTHTRSRHDAELELVLDPVIEAYKRDLDRSLLRENLTKSVEERVTALMALQQLASEARRAGRVALRRAPRSG